MKYRKMKYRKKPVEVEAFRFGLDEMPGWFYERDHLDVLYDSMSAKIKTLEGEMVARRGDWIIKGVKGEIYPCKPDIFEMTYEKVEE